MTTLVRLPKGRTFLVPVASIRTVRDAWTVSAVVGSTCWPRLEAEQLSASAYVRPRSEWNGEVASPLAANGG